MSDVLALLTKWLETLRDNPLLAAGVGVVLVAFYLLTTWKPKASRDAEARLREIRDETHDYYRHMRPPGR
jgi:hypothetical protein